MNQNPGLLVTDQWNQLQQSPPVILGWVEDVRVRTVCLWWICCADILGRMGHTPALNAFTYWASSMQSWEPHMIYPIQSVPERHGQGRKGLHVCGVHVVWPIMSQWTRNRPFLTWRKFLVWPLLNWQWKGHWYTLSWFHSVFACQL